MRCISYECPGKSVIVLPVIIEGIIDAFIQSALQWIQTQAIKEQEGLRQTSRLRAAIRSKVSEPGTFPLGVHWWLSGPGKTTKLARRKWCSMWCSDSRLKRLVSPAIDSFAGTESLNKRSLLRHCWHIEPVHSADPITIHTHTHTHTYPFVLGEGVVDHQVLLTSGLAWVGDVLRERERERERKREIEWNGQREGKGESDSTDTYCPYSRTPTVSRIAESIHWCSPSLWSSHNGHAPPCSCWSTHPCLQEAPPDITEKRTPTE